MRPSGQPMAAMTKRSRSGLSRSKAIMFALSSPLSPMVLSLILWNDDQCIQYLFCCFHASLGNVDACCSQQKAPRDLGFRESIQDHHPDVGGVAINILTNFLASQGNNLRAVLPGERRTSTACQRQDTAHDLLVEESLKSF